MASNSPSDPTLDEFLKNNRLHKYKEKILDAGVQQIDDLQDIMDDKMLTDIGMTPVDMNRFKRKVSEVLGLEPPKSPTQEARRGDLPFSPVPASPGTIRRIITQQSIRTNLNITYQLFTQLKPQEKHLGIPINGEKMHYFDLVNIICEQERATLGNYLTIELYTCEGYPLATNPSCYISKLSDWCLETYNPILLYAVPRPKAFTVADREYSTNVKKMTGNEHVIYIRNEKVGFGPKLVAITSKAVTVKKLKEYIFSMTSLPPSCFTLESGSVKLHNGQKTLNEYGIRDQSVIEIIPNVGLCDSSWDRNFFLGSCLPTWNESQTLDGKRIFFSTLYALSEWIYKKFRKDPNNNIIGHIRSMTGCAPLIHALKLLFQKQCLFLPHRVAIQELLMLVFKTFGPVQLKGDTKCPFTIQENRILEETNTFWAYFINFAKDYHARTEDYTTFNLCCSIKNNRMIEPKRVTDSEGIPHIIDKANYKVEIEEEMFEPLPEYSRMVKSFPDFKVEIWNVKEIETTEVDLTREWTTIVTQLSELPFLCIQLPLALKEVSCPVPCMTLRDNGMICNYIGPCKDVNKPYEGFDPIDGDIFIFDADDLDEKLRKGNFPQFVKLLQQRDTNVANPTVDFTTITRPLDEIEEIIMVVLDTSGSMDSNYFANKTKYELAMTGFIQFCNRTAAYNFRNMIGLVLFGSNSKLELQPTESFRYFSNETKAFPNKGQTAIYDAIVFAIENLNSFKMKKKLSNNLPTRILCLTDGGDNVSRKRPIDASFSLISNNIVMDSILLCEGKVITHAIAKLSGGYSFQPKDQKELLRIFENETMLNLACRKYKNPLEITLNEALLIPYDTDPEFLYPDKLTSTFQTSEKCLANAVLDKIVTSQVSVVVTKRILRELAYLQTDPHPFFEVFPCSDAIDLWHLMLEAPELTPYDKGVFRLYVEFTKDYPNKAPNIRFITPIYHCNINSAGRICHKVLDKFYSPEKKIKEILGHIYGLLLETTPDDPLDSYKATLLRTNKPEYDREVREFTQLHACNKTKRDVRIEILGGDPDIRKSYPARFICPLTLSLFKDPVVTCYGETYEKQAIEEYVQKEKKDPFSFKPLQKDNLYPNNTVKEGVEEFRSKLANL